MFENYYNPSNKKQKQKKTSKKDKHVRKTIDNSFPITD